MIDVKTEAKNFSKAEPKDIIFPLLYIVIIFVIGFLIWKLVSPILAVALGGLVAYFHFLRDIVSGKE